MFKIKQAIILAAGRGNRLRPYTNKTPKPLLKVKGKPIIEYEIEALRQQDIKDILIITGYRSTQFKYLLRKYKGIEIRRNPSFNKGTNLLSLQYALDKFKDCIVLDGDIILKPSAIRSSVIASGYSYVKEKCACEWSIEFDESKKITNIIPDLSEKHDFNALHSISYWVGEQAQQCKRMLQNANDEDINYADDIMIQVPNLYAFEMTHDDFLEIDTTEEYENANKD